MAYRRDESAATNLGRAMVMRRAWLMAAAMALSAALAGAVCAQVELQEALRRMPPVFGEPAQCQRKGRESIYAIARRFGVSASAINNANEGDLAAGDELLLIPTQHIAPLPAWEVVGLREQASSSSQPARPGGAGVSVVINLAERNLYVYRDGTPFRCYPVAIGMRGWQTPTGEFTIINKRKNPTWFPPEWAVEEEPVPPGPKNPLGDRWMGLSAPGYGMHATNAPSSIGRYVSHGCIRMYPEHARELYDLVSVGTPVKIVYEPVTFGYRADDGMVYMGHHPDPYQLGEVTLEEVKKGLEEWGLAGVMDEQAVVRALEKPGGPPVPVVGSRVAVSVDGRTMKLPLAPIPTGDDWLVPVGPLAWALGARLEIGWGGSFASLERDGGRVFFSPGNREALVNGRLVTLNAAPQLAAGYPVAPLALSARALGASVGFDSATNTVLVWSGNSASTWGR